MTEIAGQRSRFPQIFNLLFLSSLHSFHRLMHQLVSLCVVLGTAAFFTCCTSLSDIGGANCGGGAGFSHSTSTKNASMMSWGGAFIY